jgi:hemerythrin-like domain-containing protein
MKIAKELCVLVKEHHVALSLANRCVNVVKSNQIDEIKSLSQLITQDFENNFSEHFATEECSIFSKLKGKSPKLFTLVEQLTIEHQTLLQLAKNLKKNPELLLSFGQLLKSHSRLEDRELFSHINLLSVKQRQYIATISATHAPIMKL